MLKYTWNIDLIVLSNTETFVSAFRFPNWSTVLSLNLSCMAYISILLLISICTILGLVKLSCHRLIPFNNVCLVAYLWWHWPAASWATIANGIDHAVIFINDFSWAVSTPRSPSLLGKTICWIDGIQVLAVGTLADYIGTVLPLLPFCPDFAERP